MAQIEIELSPVNGFTRKAIFDKLIYNMPKKKLSTHWDVRLFKTEEVEEEEVLVELKKEEYPWYSPYQKEFIADETTWVDPATGEYVEEGTPGSVTEWHYFSEIVANNEVKVNELIEAVGVRKANDGKFESL